MYHKTIEYCNGEISEIAYLIFNKYLLNMCAIFNHDYLVIEETSFETSPTRIDQVNSIAFQRL